jgi:aminoglycoside phosphotransferase family enzyme/predicted kinase
MPAADPTLAKALREHLQAATGHPVSLVETHISWVLITHAFAYKLKKPVHLSFVDFRTLAARKHFCEEEIRLNRRLAPSLYLGVVPVFGRPEAPRLEGGTEAIEYAVWMRRFPEEELACNLVRSGRLEPVQIDRFAQRLAAFHAQAEIAAPSSGFGSARQVPVPMNLTLSGLAAECGTDPALPGQLQAWVADRCEALRDTWQARQHAGAVRECHGDLHLANVVRVDCELTAFDGVEFDPALRWIDVMSDVAFFTMDLDAHGRAELAWRFLDGWLQHSGDFGGLAVLRFYEVYRAAVRALVQRLRVRATGEPCAPGDPDYLRWAAQRAAAAGHAPRLMITHGLSGSGKSTVAARLLEIAGAIRIRSDVERKRLFGLAPLQRSAERALDIYTPEATRRTFEHLAGCARTALEAGYPVIVDAAFLRREERRAFRLLAAALDVPFSILWCHAAEGQLRQRVAARDAARGDASEADPAVLQRQIATQEPLDDDERSIALDVDTGSPPDLPALRARWLSAGR